MYMWVCLCLFIFLWYISDMHNMYALGNSGQHIRVLWAWFTVRNKMWDRWSSSSIDRKMRHSMICWFVADTAVLVAFVSIIVVIVVIVLLCFCLNILKYYHEDNYLKRLRKLRIIMCTLNIDIGDSFDRRVRETIISSFNFSIWCDDVVVVQNTNE